MGMAEINAPALPRADEESLDHAFKYHAPTPEMLPLFEALRSSAKEFARQVLICCPSSADRTAALRQIQDAVMTANRSIALGGKGMR
jgi:hypothetical protein